MAKKERRVVRREVVRLVTPGTLFEEFLPGKRQNYLLALHPSADGQTVALAWSDLSTGEKREERLASVRR